MSLEMKYFVLNPRKADQYGHASRSAMFAYADAIEDENPTLARELRIWAGKEEARIQLENHTDARIVDD